MKCVDACGPNRAQSVAAFVSLAVVSLAAAGWVLTRGARAPEVQAAVFDVVDDDGDGLSTTLELVIGTDPFFPDSDVDGYADAEEYARHSDPISPWSTPLNAEVSVGMGATKSPDGIHAIAVMYVQDGDISDNQLSLGMMINGVMMPIPAFVIGTPTITTVPTCVPGELVLVYEYVLNPCIMRRTGEASIFTTLGAGTTVGADALNLKLSATVVLQRLEVVSEPGNSPGTTVMSSQSAGGSVFRPLGGSMIPAGWTAGEICSQTTTTVGYTGAAVTQEVTSASCQGGWDAYCDPGCAATVGTTIHTVDPGVLAGG